MDLIANMQAQVTAEIRGNLGILTLNRPAALNALTLQMVRELRAALDAWAGDSAVQVVLFRGAGDKAFCAGGDVHWICDDFKAGRDEYLTFFGEEYELDHLIHRYPKPTVALMDGYVMGGGMGISQGCRVRVVTERTRLAMPEVGIGFFPDVGASYFLSRLSGALGLYLGLTGVQVKAADALYAGLADHFVSSASLQAVINRLAGTAWAPGDEAGVKACIRGAVSEVGTEESLKRLRDAIDHHFSNDSVGAILASLRQEQRPAYAEWATSTLNTMTGRSPLAMCVTLEQLRRARSMTLEQCLDMEWAMGREWLPRGDMVEGVRALLVDKDKNPKWTPPSLQQVGGELVASFFPAPGALRLRLKG